MRVFLDFEASSLSDDSYPIEVGWVFEDGRGEAHLIRPAPGWDDWDPTAQAIHGIDRDRLIAEGEPHDLVARRLLDVLGPEKVYVGAPSWDGKWLSVLLRAAGFPRHAMRLIDSDEAMMDAARSELSATAPPKDLEAAAAALVQDIRRRTADRPAAHRALADARQELEVWMEVSRAAAARAQAGERAPVADAYHLQRFKDAQAPVFDQALAELRAGRKEGHWMWFVFPQIEGLGFSAMSQTFAISGLAEARAYLADPVLGPRLEAAVEAILGDLGRTAEQIFGPVDALKLRSSLTLFRQAAPDEPLFQRALDRFFGGEPDAVTLQRLG